MELSFINVGYGDAILIEQNNQTMLLDGGSSCKEEFEGFPNRMRAAEYLRRAQIPQIDLLMISHIHEDHVCGLEQILYEFPVREMVIPYEPALFMESRVFEPDDSAPRSAHLFARALSALTRMVQYAVQNGIPVRMAQPETVYDFAGLQIKILAPNAEKRQEFEQHLADVFRAEDCTDKLVLLDCISNQYSLLVKISAGQTDVLLAADNCPSGWKDIASSEWEKVQILKLPHHGQRDSMEERVAQGMPLRYAITTASSDRRYQSACPAVYEMLRRLHPKVQLLFTDECVYEPFFGNPDGANAIKLVVDSGEVTTEFIKI
ncbi:MAG: ComEC/Rec2 family competence protein [Butyricicoccus sp.]